MAVRAAWLCVSIAVLAAGCDTPLGRRVDLDGGADSGARDATAIPHDAARDTADVGSPNDTGADAFVPSDAGTDAYSTPCTIPAAGLDLGMVTLYANPPDLARWPITTHLTEVDFTNDGVHVVFDKQDGPNRWPDVTPPGWMGPLQYTLGMIECVDGQWYGSAVIEFWYGLPAEGGNVALNDQIAINWYYDAIRWGRLAGRQPRTGETIGIFVAAGNLRNITADDPAQSPVMERSNVVLMPFPDTSGATHSF